MPTISVVIPTLNGGAEFVHLCRHLALVKEHHGLDVLVIDSGSTDGTPEAAERSGLRVHRIAPEEFGHGRTRNLGVRMTEGEVVCFLTQDVLPCTPDWPLRFAEVLSDPAVAGVYGRQVPRDATTMEMFFVALNYPAEALRFDPQPEGHHPRPGRVLFSNAFSAVRRDVALEIPFVDEVPVSEDQVWAHQVLEAEYSVAYEPQAEALHAHRYTLKGLFRRTYLVGRALRTIGLARGASLPESVRFLTTELAYFVKQGHTHRLPELLAYEFVRWVGFQAGRSDAFDGLGNAHKRLRHLGRSGWNLLASSAAELWIRAIGLVYLVALARYLQPEGFGTFNMLLAYFAVAATLGNFGLDQLTLRELARIPNQRSTHFTTLFALRIFVAAVAGVLLLGIGYSIKPEFFGFFAVLAVALLPAAAASSFTAAYQSRERFGVPAAAAMLGSLTMAGVSLVGVTAHAPISFFLWVLVAAEVARAGLLMWTAHREGWGINFAVDPSFARYALSAALPYGILATLGVIYFRVDIIMLDALAGEEVVGHYAGAYRVFEAFVPLSALVMGVMFPRFVRLQQVNPRRAQALYVGTSRILLCLGLFLSVLVIILAGPILRTLYTEDYAGASATLGWLMVALVFLFWHAPSATVLFSGEHLKAVVWLSFITAGFNVACNFILIPRYGAAGAAAATAASEVLSLMLFAPLVFRRLGISPKDYLRALFSRLTRADLALLVGTDRTSSGPLVEAHAK